MTDGVPYLLLPYQARLFADESRVIVIEKARRIGMTYTLACKAVDRGATGEMDTWYMSYSEDAGVEFIRDCAYWAGIYQVAHSEVQLLEKFDATDGSSESIKVNSIQFGNGRRICPAVSSTAASGCVHPLGNSREQALPDIGSPHGVVPVLTGGLFMDRHEVGARTPRMMKHLLQALGLSLVCSGVTTVAQAEDTATAKPLPAEMFFDLTPEPKNELSFDDGTSEQNLYCVCLHKECFPAGDRGQYIKCICIIKYCYDLNLNPV